jgi:adenylosuccinate synthase
MRPGKFNVLLDAFWGSSGKGLMSTWLADHFRAKNVSSSNYPNAGHSARFPDGRKFVAKAIPTAAVLKAHKDQDIHCWISPGSGFKPERLVEEWLETGKPRMTIHGRASVVTDDHMRREREGKDSTKHIASTMQGTAAALTDKVLRKADCLLARNIDWEKYVSDSDLSEFKEKVHVFSADAFRDRVQTLIARGDVWLHEGSQGYALSIDHGSHYPFCTSRNCSIQAAMDHMAIPPQMVGDIYLNVRSYAIRVGNVYEDGVQKGFSGDFYPDCEELTWEEVARRAGMPPEEVEKLKAREYTTVTGRLRRVSTISWMGLKDAVRTNGATNLMVNFIQYINWNDRGLKGGHEAFGKLSSQSRAFIDKIEEETDTPVSLIGTGANHDEIISLL